MLRERLGEAMSEGGRVERRDDGEGLGTIERRVKQWFLSGGSASVFMEFLVVRLPLVSMRRAASDLTDAKPK